MSLSRLYEICNEVRQTKWNFLLIYKFHFVCLTSSHTGFYLQQVCLLETHCWEFFGESLEQLDRNFLIVLIVCIFFFSPHGCVFVWLGCGQERRESLIRKRGGEDCPYCCDDPSQDFPLVLSAKAATERVRACSTVTQHRQPMLCSK